MTALRIDVPCENPSPVLASVAQVDRVGVRTNSAHHMVLEFNGGARRESADLRPALPLTVRW